MKLYIKGKIYSMLKGGDSSSVSKVILPYIVVVA